MTDVQFIWEAFMRDTGDPADFFEWIENSPFFKIASTKVPELTQVGHTFSPSVEFSGTR